jgi:hypothetical protein
MIKITLKDLKLLADKYNISKSGTKTKIADRLCGLRSTYLLNTERTNILPFCSKNKNKKIMETLIKTNYRKEMPINV